MSGSGQEGEGTVAEQVVGEAEGGELRVGGRRELDRGQGGAGGADVGGENSVQFGGALLEERQLGGTHQHGRAGQLIEVARVILVQVRDDHAVQ